MVARFLITTADERSWRTDRPVLFLGEWCRLYERRVAWEQLDAEMVPYHWDDREQLYRDYLYLRKLYEALLAELSEVLNGFHGVRNSSRYWRILVGPWLGYFTQMLFDRWVMIQRAVRDYEIAGTAVLDLPPEQLIPNDKAHFDKLFVDDHWNHAIYGRILSGWTNVSCERAPAREAAEGALADSCAPPLPLKRRLQRVGARGLSILSRVLSRPTDAFFISSYLPLGQDFQLQLALGQVPKLWRSFSPPQVAPDLRVRQKFRLPGNDFKGFEGCVRSLISEQIPTLYLEGYRTLQTVIAKLPWPKCPRVIFTSNNFNSDDIFKSWAGEKVGYGSPLIIGQHGGHYGTGLWNYSEEHELAIADRYLTWGWADGGTKQYPVGALKLNGLGPGAWNPNGGMLLVTGLAPRYSYWMYSIMVAGQTAHYLDDQFRFASALTDELRRQLLVRIYAHDYKWSQAARWQDRHPDVRLDYGDGPIEYLIRRSRLYVATYNATTFLEALGRNIPTIMFWNAKHWELRPSALPYFDRLKQAGIFHETPELAAAKATEVWYDVAGWWNRSDVQEARRYFCDRFARMPENPTHVLKEALTTVEAEQHA